MGNGKRMLKYSCLMYDHICGSMQTNSRYLADSGEWVAVVVVVVVESKAANGRMQENKRKITPNDLFGM